MATVYIGADIYILIYKASMVGILPEHLREGPRPGASTARIEGERANARAVMRAVMAAEAAADAATRADGVSAASAARQRLLRETVCLRMAVSLFACVCCCCRKSTPTLDMRASAHASLRTKRKDSESA